MFKGSNFVYNHIFNKHMDMIEENLVKYHKRSGANLKTTAAARAI